MATASAERPQFFEGQYLGADDLAAIVAYLRTSDARQNLGQHSWGIAIGLDLVSQAISDTAVEYYVQPGVAVDGYGRIIVVSNPTRIEVDQFVSLASGDVDVWIRYDESDFSATRPGFNVCAATDNYSRISESFKIEVGRKASILDRQSGVTVNDTLLVDAREALSSVDPDAQLLCDASVPHQQLPVDDEAAIWLVPLGHVKWNAATSSFAPLVSATALADLANGDISSDEAYESLIAGRTKRRLTGVVAESLFAADGLIRLRERTAEPDPAAGNDAVCYTRKVQSADLFFCDGRLKPKELVWLEGATRIKGDARLFGGRLEFKDKEGRDYIERTVGGNTVSAITPALFQRRENNEKGGTDLQAVLGKSADGINRFTFGSIEFAGTDLCKLTISSEHKVVIQDNGLVGIGTTNPDSLLVAPLTIRGLSETVVENEGTEDAVSYPIYRLQSYEADTGVAQWQVDLWDTDGSERKSLNLTESGLAKTRLFLQGGGNIGVGTVEPTEQVHIVSNDPALFIDINSTSGLDRAGLIFGQDGGGTAGIYWSKGSDKVFIHHNGDNAVVIDGDNVGMGTDAPATTLHIGSGNDVDLGDSAGYLLLGEVGNLNVVMDNNEIQARDNGDAAELHLQAEGGDLFVHRWVSGAEVMIKADGDVGIGTTNPAEKLDVRGDIRFGASGDLFAMGGVEALRTVVGRVNGTGSVAQGAGYTVSKGSTGNYTINFSPAFASTPVVVANSYGNSDNILSVTSVTSSSCGIRIRDIRSRTEDPGESAAIQPEDNAFTFIAIGER